ncbi:MAG TPA: lysophospholipid acyltransferase family protein [Acidimicrobiales bacterium]|nr:lysophospholipid acyltransferase family protein [Acidimicrobiales bacterium]
MSVDPTSGDTAGDTAAAVPAGAGAEPARPPRATSRATARRAGAEDRPLKAIERAFYQIARLTFIIFGKLFWRVEIEGLEQVPRDRPVVISPVHRSNIDTILMAFLSRRPLRYMAKASLFRHRWSAVIITALGGFPVYRDGSDREALRTCESALRRGESVVVFPEGTRKAGPVVTDLYEGAAFVALRGGVPIVPVGIGGSAGAMPKGSKFVHPVKIRIIVGPPIVPPSRAGAAARGTRRQVRELTDQLQRDLQRLYDRAEGRTGETPAGGGTGE